MRFELRVVEIKEPILSEDSDGSIGWMPKLRISKYYMLQIRKYTWLSRIGLNRSKWAKLNIFSSLERAELEAKFLLTKKEIKVEKTYNSCYQKFTKS